MLYREIIIAAGHEVVAELSNGIDALASYQQLKPALLVIDHNMARMTGIEVVRQIHSKDQEHRIIMCTANPEQIFNEAMQLGVREVIGKPFHIDRLLESVDFALK